MRKEIIQHVLEGSKKVTSWKVEDNGFLSAVIDTGKIIGHKRECGSPTSKILIILDGNKLHNWLWKVEKKQSIGKFQNLIIL